MAKILNMSIASYQKKERGESPLLARELLKIAEISDVPMADIDIPN